MLVEEEDEEGEGGQEAELQQQGDEDELPLVQNMKLSLWSFAGPTSNKFFKVTVRLMGRRC